MRFRALGGFSNAGLSYTSSSIDAGYLKRYGDDTSQSKYKHKGLLTGVAISVLASDGSVSNAYLYNTMYYDKQKRLIQLKETNYLGGIEARYTAYNFVGQPVQITHTHTAEGKKEQKEVLTYTYDHAGRLLATTHQLNNGVEVTLVSNEYDELGRLKSNSYNGQSNLKTNYTYNIRSWIKTISNSLFTQTLYYNDHRSSGTNNPSYNGSISGMDWKVANDKNRGYNFSYDGSSRLTGASYIEGDICIDKFSTSYRYDKHGNMLSLRRRGNVGISTYGVIDSLTLLYHGNQLVSVEDKGTEPSLSMSMDFKDGSHESVEYSYDSNGNMVKDLNKGISRIEYNFLNLPQRISFSGANNPVNEYVCSAVGKKLSVIHKSSTEKRTDYVGNMIYENGSLKRILVDGGYIENGVYHFYLQDHLGNNRVVAKSNGTVVQTTHYYPYGMSFAEGTFADKQPYKYNGKELDTENGLNLYDYDARQMEAALGRFTSVDPMAEKYYNWSPYVYVGNNPLKYIDPDGRDPISMIYRAYKGYKAYKAYRTARAATVTVKSADVVGTVVTGSVAVTYSYNQFLSPDQAAVAQQSILAGIESIANQNAAVSPEYEHQQKRDREGKEKRDQEQANVAKSIDTNVSGNMPNGDPAPKRGPKGGIWVKLGLGVSGGGAAAATLHSVVEGSQLQVPVPEQHSDQPEIKPQPQPVNWLQTIINLFK